MSGPIFISIRQQEISESDNHFEVNKNAQDPQKSKASWQVWVMADDTMAAYRETEDSI